jgi:hypothetical protein
MLEGTGDVAAAVTTPSLVLRILVKSISEWSEM